MTRLKIEAIISIMIKGDIMIIKSKSTNLYTELIWNTKEFNNIKNRKITLCSSIWNNFINNKYSYIKILYFKHYNFFYCSKRIASYKKILKSDSLPSVIKNASKCQMKLILFQRMSMMSMR